MKLKPHAMTRRFTMLALLGCAAFSALPAGLAAAQDYPNKPLTIVVPASTGGTNDRAARIMARFLSEEMKQPVTVINRPGGGNLLGHVYFQQQPADGYTLLRTTAAPYLSVNQLLQGAEFKVEEFQPINLPELGTTIIATANDKPFKSIEDVLKTIRANPGKVSVGVQPTATDMINLMIFLEAMGLSEKDVRIVTYDSGGPVRNGILGGQFDIGVVGDQGMAPLKGQFRPLMTFSEERSKQWDTPSVVEVAKAEGKTYSQILSGSLQGYLVHSKLKTEHPDRYAKLVDAFKRISSNPAAMKAFQDQDLSLEWIGPEKSREILMKQHELLQDPKFLRLLRPN